MKKRDAFCLLGAALLMAACSGVPSGVIPPERMARLMADLEIAESVVETEPAKFRGDSLKKTLLQSVYLRNGVTSEEVDSSMMWYGRHIVRYKDVVARTVEILQDDEEQARVAAGRASGRNSAIGGMTADGDSVDVWNLSRLWRLSRTSPASIVRFNLSRDRNWEPGDGDELRFKTVGAVNPVEVSLAAECQLGKRVFINERRRGNGWHSVRLQLDSAATASQLYGTLTYLTSGPETVYLDSITLIRTHWKKSRAHIPAAQQSINK